MKRILYSEIRAKLDGPYEMRLAGRDADVVVKAGNQGIDAHLEACNCVGQDKYEWKPRYVGKGKNRKVLAVHLHCSVSPKSLPTLLRRLTEFPHTGEDDDDAECGSFLAATILEGLGFEGLETGRVEVMSDEEQGAEEEEEEEERAEADAEAAAACPAGR